MTKNLGRSLVTENRMNPINSFGQKMNILLFHILNNVQIVTASSDIDIEKINQ